MKSILEAIAFLVLTVILFNEFATLAQILGFFDAKIIPQMGSISVALASLNILSKSFLGIQLVDN